MAADGNARWCRGLEHEPWWDSAGQAGMTSGCCCSCQWKFYKGFAKKQLCEVMMSKVDWRLC
jgi:hypothetical protein